MTAADSGNASGGEHSSQKKAVTDMDPQLRFVGEFIFANENQWLVPAYQRHYVWGSRGDDEIPVFWEDLKNKTEEVLKAVKSRRDKAEVKPVYLGAIICMDAHGSFGARTRELIDGQQRITTLHLALLAVREVARELRIKDRSFPTDIDQKVRDCLLVDSKFQPKAFTDKNSRLIASKADRSRYKDLYQESFTNFKRENSGEFVKGSSHRIKLNAQSAKMTEAYATLRKEIWDFIGERDESPHTVLSTLLETLLEKFKLIVIAIGTDDEGQEIFASLNGLGVPLTQFDLVRNNIFLRLKREEEKDSEIFWNDHWYEFEDPFWSEPEKGIGRNTTRADHLLHGLVVAEEGQQVIIGRIAKRYEKLVSAKYKSDDGKSVDKEIEVLGSYAAAYRSLTKGDPPVFQSPMRLLAGRNLSPLRPLLLWIAKHYPGDDNQDKEDLFRLMDSYAVRRAACGKKEKGLNKDVPILIRRLMEEPKDSRKNLFFDIILGNKKLPGWKNSVPHYDEVKRVLREYKIYDEDKGATLHILKELEIRMGGNRDVYELTDSDLDIEHILPQVWEKDWEILVNGKKRKADPKLVAKIRNNKGNPPESKEAQRIKDREEALHIIGNLTLATKPLNGHLGNKSWEEKKKGFREHAALKINRVRKGPYFWEAGEKHWDESSISERTEYIASLINKHWPRDPRTG